MRKGIVRKTEEGKQEMLGKGKVREVRLQIGCLREQR